MPVWDQEPGGGWETFLAQRELYLGAPRRRHRPAARIIPLLSDGWNLRDPERVAAAYTADARVARGGDPRIARGRVEIGRAVALVMDEIPDGVYRITGSVDGSDAVTLEWMIVGTRHPADGGPAHRVEVHGASVCRLEDGLISAERVYSDPHLPGGRGRARGHLTPRADPFPAGPRRRAAGP